VSNRFASLVALVALGALLAAGCDTVRPVALEVDGQETSQSSLDRELRAIADNEVLAEQGVSASDGTLGSNITAFWATLLVEQEVIDRVVRRRGIEVTDADREDGLADIDAQFGEGVFAAFPGWFRDRIGARFARRHALLRDVGDVAAGPTDEEVRGAYDQQLSEIKAQCPSGKFVAHILVATEDEANLLRAQLFGGADFAELARTESQDPGSAEVGGELFCFDAAQFVPEFSTAADALPLGEVSAPVQTEFGFHLIRTSDTIPFESVEERVRESLEPQTSSSPALDRLIAKANVSVDPRYGTWKVQEGEGMVVPPESASSTTSPAPTP
jgi:foldase protein PrsA